MSILEHFDKRAGRKPRPEQQRILEEIERCWDDFDVFCIRAPTASGKSLISDCISAWQAVEGESVHVVVPDNLLLKQAEAEFNTSAALMWSQKHYTCRWKGLDDRWVEGNRANCPAESCRKRFTEGCPYTRSLKKWQRSRVRVSNYWMPGAHKMIDKCGVLIIDEAHSYFRFIAGLASKRLWHREFNYPLNIETYADIKAWATKEVERFKGRKMAKTDKDFIHYTNLMLLWNELEQDCQKYSVVATEAEYRGTPQPCIELKPIKVCDAVPLAISKKTRKLVLMSATLSEFDVKDLGFTHKRVKFLDVASGIPVENRPVFVRPCLSNRSVTGYQDAGMVLEALKKVAARMPTEKGIVHTTYDMARCLKALIASEGYSDLTGKMMFHDKFNKRQVLAEFMACKEPRILVACGMTEGVDFKGDLARFQIIAKIAWPSLIDPVYQRLSEENPDAYAWIAARMVMQAAGRVCRTPDDYRETYIFDSSFKRISEHLWLGWFKAAVRYI